MWSLFSEPIEKEYYARCLSRSWCLSVACCLFAFVVPILILASIGCTLSFIKIPGMSMNARLCSLFSVFKITKRLVFFQVV